MLKKAWKPRVGMRAAVRSGKKTTYGTVVKVTKKRVEFRPDGENCCKCFPLRGMNFTWELFTFLGSVR